MDGSNLFLFAAFGIAWLVLLLYLWQLSSRLAALQREVERLSGESDSERS